MNTGSDNHLHMNAVLSARLHGFVHFLREHGFVIGASEIQIVHQIATLPLLQNKPMLRSALQSTLCKSQERWRQFPALFATYWFSNFDDPATDEETIQPRGTEATGLSYFSESLAQDASTNGEAETMDLPSGGASDARTLGQRDFRFVFNPHDMRRIEHIVDDIAQRMQKRLKRTTQPHKKQGQLDLRRMARHSIKYNGYPFERRYKRKQRAPSRFLLLLDVSQSMEIYSYLFLRFARGLLQAFKDTDAYAFHTDLIPIGTELHDKSTIRLEQKLKNLSEGWLGGTRIADSLQAFNNQHATQSLNKNTYVIIFSDGYDSGDPEDLVQEVLRIKTSCHKLIWVNPLLGRLMPGNKPLPVEQSMAAVLPYLDLYTSAHSLKTLRNLEQAFRLR